MSIDSQIKRILILSANPRGTTQLRLDEEVREIREGLRLTKDRAFEVESRWAVRVRDVRRAMLEVQPQVVHFSGHGSSDGWLAFEDTVGQAKLVAPEALANLFALFTDQVELVLLNACHSVTQALAIAQHIDYVIGMTQAIGDRAAIEFAVGFYDALGAGRTVEDAFQFGCNAIQMEDIPEELTPTIIKSPKLGGTNYSRLCALLTEENWQEADQETRSLMLKIAGRERDGFLTAEDISKFPVQDLVIIDQLWSQCSNGTFGFSEQKRILRDAGVSKSASSLNLKTFRECMSLEEQKVTSKTYFPKSEEIFKPEGMWLLGYVQGVDEGLKSLFSRIKSCASSTAISHSRTAYSSTNYDRELELSSVRMQAIEKARERLKLKEIQKKILEVICEMRTLSPHHTIVDADIAQNLKLDLKQVQYYLECMAQEGYLDVRVISTFDGKNWHVFDVQPKGWMLIQET